VGRVTIGVDIGQQRDPTAIVVTEAIRRELTPARWEMPADRRMVTGSDVRMVGAKVETVFEVRAMERLALGTPYPGVAERVVEVARNLHDRHRTVAESLYLTLVVDVTGVGRPVVDLLADALRGVPCRLVAATFTHGDRLTGKLTDREVSVGKAFLVSRLQSLFQTDRLKMPAEHPEAEPMLRELMDYEIRVDADANDRYGAFRVGTHDDLVTALGLAVIADPPGQQVFAV